MKRLLSIAALLLAASPLMAQHTQVSAQVVDVNGSLYTNCSGSASFVNLNTTPGAGPPLLNGGVFQTSVPIQCDSTAHFSIPVADNNAVSPGPSQWRFTLCAPSGLSAGGVPPPICFNLTLTITGATQTITSQLTAVAPLLPVPGGGGGNKLSVNGVALVSTDTADFNNTTPVASANSLNVHFQTSHSGAVDSISAEIVGDGTATHCLNGTGAWSGCGGVSGATTNGGLLLTGTTLGLRTDCTDQQFLDWSSGSTAWVCASVPGGLADPGASGIVFRTTLNTTRIAGVSDFPILNQNTTGNAATATALATTPTQCTGNNVASGIAASGNANCEVAPLSNTASALAATPTQCTAGNWATGIAASGNANCSPPPGGIASVTGTVNQISVTAGANPVLSIPSPFVPPGVVNVPVGPVTVGSGAPGIVDVETQGVYAYEIANNGTTGTLLNKTVCDDGTGHGIVCPHASSTTNVVVGFCVANCGTTGNATVSMLGWPSVIFDNASTAFHYAVNSTSVDGDLSDTGSTALPAGQPFFFVWTANAGAGTVGLIRMLLATDFNASSSGGGGTFTATTSPITAATSTLQFDASLLNAVYGGNGNGTSDNTAAMNAACSAKGQVWLPAGAYAFTASYAFPAGCSLHFGAGATLVAPTGVAITNLLIDSAPKTKLFTLTGTGSVAFGPQANVYAEWWGVTGTADYTPINAALKALVDGGTVQLLCKDYTITGGTITFVNSYTSLNGCARGFQASLITGSAGSTNIKSATTTGDMIDIVGSGANCTTGSLFANSVTNLELYRTSAPTAGYGIKLQNLCWSPRIENVAMYDAGLVGIYLTGVANSFIIRTNIQWTVTAAGTHSGIEVDGTTANKGTTIDYVNVGATAATHTRALYIHGANISDLWTSHFQQSNTDYGVYLDATAATGVHAAEDISFDQSIFDLAFVSAYFINGLTGATTSQGTVTIIGGQASTSSSSSPVIDIESSVGVNVQGVQVRLGTGSTGKGIYINGGAANSVSNVIYNGIQGSGSPIALNATASNVITGNILASLATFAGTDIALTGSTLNTISNNTMTAYAGVGMSADATSNNNIFFGNTVDSTHVTTAFTDAGTGNSWGMHAPGPIGDTTASTGAFTTATGTSFATTGLFGTAETYTQAACETAGAPTTLNTGATTTVTGLSCLPANSVIDMVVGRVTTTITGACTGWELGDGTTAARFSSNNTTLTSGTTTDGAHAGTFNTTGIASATTGMWQASAGTITVTCAGGNPSAGAIRIIVFYHTWTPPTS